MKAAHRKELHTNALADRMGRLVESVKAGPTSTSAVVWIFVFLALGTFAVWKYYSSAGPLEDSARWIELRQATHDPSRLGVALEGIAKDSKGRMQARVARYQLARVLVKEGQENLASNQFLVVDKDNEANDDLASTKRRFGDVLNYDRLKTKRDLAIEMLRGARRIYEQMIRETKAFPLLYQEALMGAAKTEEALLGVTDDAATPQGTVEQALKHYLQLVQFNLKQLGKAVPPEEAVTTLEALVGDQLQKLGQECEPDKALYAYQKLADVAQEKFKGEAGAWRDLSYPGRAAAGRAKELQQDPQKVLQFYAKLNELASPPKFEEPKRPESIPIADEPSPDVATKKGEEAKKAPEAKKVPEPKPDPAKKGEEPKKTEAPKTPPPKPDDVKKGEPKKDAEPKKGTDAPKK